MYNSSSYFIQLVLVQADSEMLGQPSVKISPKNGKFIPYRVKLAVHCRLMELATGSSSGGAAVFAMTCRSVME